MGVLSFFPALLIAEIQTKASTEVQDRIEDLIKQLGHPRYVLREQAQAELAQMGPPVLDALSAALLSDDIEIAMRARYLLTAINIDWVDDSDPRHIRNAMKNYEKKNYAQRKNVISQLAPRMEDAELSALSRIVRYDKSTPLSKFAALIILDAPLRGDSWKNRRDRLDEQLQGSQRPAVQWVRRSINEQRDQKLQIDDWTVVAETENALWINTSDQTNIAIVQKVFLYLIGLLRDADREGEAVTYEDQVVALQTDSDQSIRELVELLLEKRLPRIIEKLGDRFNDLFSSDPLLLYALAYAKQSLGKSTAATQLAEKAQKLNPTTAPKHLVVAFRLQQQGWFEWSETEYQTAIEIDGWKTSVSLQATSVLSEMLHEQMQDKKAAEALEPLVSLLKKDPKQRAALRQINRDPNDLYSRIHFFRACQHEKEGNLKKQKDELLLAIGENPSDADVLIALYRMPNQTADERKATKARIVDAITTFRGQIKKQSNSPRPLNQFAWLVGNTLGEVDPELAEEAIRYSHKSLEFRPAAAGFLDTLGRCYYAKGDIENAIKYQTEAARLAPHSGLIRKQFNFFKRSRKEKATSS